MEHQKKLEDQHRMYLEQQQKYYEEHHKFLEQQQAYKPPPVVYQAPPMYVAPTYYRGQYPGGKSHSKSPVRSKNSFEGNLSSGGMYTSRNQVDDAFETTSRLSKNSKNSKFKGIKRNSIKGGQSEWNAHHSSNKPVSSEENQMKLMAQERRKAYDEELKRRQMAL